MARPKMKDTVQITFRLSRQNLSYLDALTLLADCTRGEWLNACISAEYERIAMSDELCFLIEQKRDVEREIQRLLKVDGVEPVEG